MIKSTIKMKLKISLLLSFVITGIVTVAMSSTFVVATDIPDVEDVIDESYIKSSLLQFAQKSITANSETQSIADGSGYVTDSGGVIKVHTGSVGINENDIEFCDSPTKIKKADGNYSYVFKATVPYEVEFNIYTVYDTSSVSPNKAFYKSDDTENEVVIGRGYFGDKLESEQTNKYGGNFWDKRDTTDAVIPDSTHRWKVVKPLLSSVNTGLSNKYNIYDGDNLFYTQQYYEWSAHVPFYSVDSTTNISSTPYTTDVNKLMTHCDSSAFDIGTMNIDWDMTLLPIIGASPSISIDDNNDASLELDGMWTSISDANIIENEKSKGYIESGFVASSTGKVSTDIISKDSDSSEVMNSAIKDKVAIYQSASPPISSSNVYVGESFTGETDYPTNPRIYSTELQKYLTSFTYADQMNMLNLTMWKLSLGGIELTPYVEVMKRDVTINYREFWYDDDGSKVDAYRDNSQSYNLPIFCGVNIYNCYIHLRLQVNIDVYSQYSLIVKQTASGYNNTFTGIIDPVISKKIWDTVDYGTKNYSTTVYSAGANADMFLDGLFDDFLSSLQEFTPYIIGLVIIVVIGLVVFLVVKGNIMSMGMGGMGMQNPYMGQQMNRPRTVREEKSSKSNQIDPTTLLLLMSMMNKENKKSDLSPSDIEKIKKALK